MLHSSLIDLVVTMGRAFRIFVWIWFCGCCILNLKLAVAVKKEEWLVFWNLGKFIRKVYNPLAYASLGLGVISFKALSTDPPLSTLVISRIPIPPFRPSELLTQSYALGHIKRIPDKAIAEVQVKEIKLLTRKNMERLFPDPNIYRDKFLGFT